VGILAKINLNISQKRGDAVDGLGLVSLVSYSLHIHYESFYFLGIRNFVKRRLVDGLVIVFKKDKLFFG
jgi:hypothetical protein